MWFCPALLLWALVASASEIVPACSSARRQKEPGWGPLLAPVLARLPPMALAAGVAWPGHVGAETGPLALPRSCCALRELCGDCSLPASDSPGQDRPLPSLTAFACIRPRTCRLLGEGSFCSWWPRPACCLSWKSGLGSGGSSGLCLCKNLTRWALASADGHESCVHRWTLEVDAPDVISLEASRTVHGVLLWRRSAVGNVHSNRCGTAHLALRAANR